MERTISGMMGNGAINHNTRAFNAKMLTRNGAFTMCSFAIPVSKGISRII